MSSICSQGVVLATAMAVSGTVILLAFRLQKSLPLTQFLDAQIPQSSQQVLRSCISSEGKKVKKKKKKVQFAEDVVEPRGNGEEFRRQHINAIVVENSSSSSSTVSKLKKSDSGDMVRKIRGMPANRAALYNGILRDRVVQRIAYSY